MRIVLSSLAPVAALAAALAASACASNPDDYNTDLRSLADACQARGGILSPTGQQSGNPARDNVCKMTAETGIAGRSRDDR